MALTLKIFSRAEGAARFMGRYELEGERLTVGRSVECTLQLPDPQRKLSRVHVEFLGAGDGYRLRVASAHSSVVVNGRDYPPGSEATLRVGDALSMDVYDLDIVSVGTSRNAPVQAEPVIATVPTREEAAVAPPSALLRPAGSGARVAKRLGIGAAAVAVVLALFLQWPRQESQIKDLTYSVQAGGRLFFKGVYKGEPFELVRTSAKNGKGSWILNVGPPTDRIRATVTDGKGLTEIQAPDMGYRMTFAIVEGRRLETRLYQKDHGFLSGSVLFRVKGRWLHGMMKSEAFAGYAELVAVTDITERIERPNLSQGGPTRMRAFDFGAFELISSARAQNQSAGTAEINVEPDVFVEQARQVGPTVVVGSVTAFKEGQAASKQQREMVQAPAKALIGDAKDKLEYLQKTTDQLATDELKEQRDRIFDKVTDKIAEAASKVFPIVAEARDSLKKLTAGRPKDFEDYADADVAAPDAPTARPDEPAPGLFSYRNIAHTIQNIVSVPVAAVEATADWVQGKFRNRADESPAAGGARDVNPSPAPNAGPSAGSPMVGRDKFGDATDQARTCIRSGDLACAQAKIAEARNSMSPEGHAGERETLSVIEHNLDSAQWEAKRKAYEKEQEARKALQTGERASAEKEAEAKRIATQATPNTSNVATPPAQPRETQDPDAARSLEFIEAQEKRRLKALADRIDILDKAAVEEDKDRKAALQRRYEAITRAEEEAQAALRRRFEQASRAQSGPRAAPVVTAPLTSGVAAPRPGTVATALSASASDPAAGAVARQAPVERARENVPRAPQLPESWAEELVMKYPDREKRETSTRPAEAVANWKSRPASLRVPQNGQVIDHRGCGSCAVGSTIVVVISYPNAKATYSYRYTRIQ